MPDELKRTKNKTKINKTRGRSSCQSPQNAEVRDKLVLKYDCLGDRRQLKDSQETFLEAQQCRRTRDKVIHKHRNDVLLFSISPCMYQLAWCPGANEDTICFFTKDTLKERTVRTLFYLLRSYQVNLYRIIPVRKDKSDGQQVPYYLRVPASQQEGFQGTRIKADPLER